MLLVSQHRNTIALDSEIQRVLHWISSALGRALQDVVSQVREMCVMADTGLELTAADLAEFLGESQHVKGSREPSVRTIVRQLRRLERNIDVLPVRLPAVLSAQDAAFFPHQSTSSHKWLLLSPECSSTLPS